MAEGGYELIPEWDYDENNDYPDDDNADQTTPFFLNGASTPYQSHVQEEMEMKTFQQKSGRPGTSYTETSFVGTEDLERRLDKLRDPITGKINTEGIPFVKNPLSYEEREKEIMRVKDFIKKRYPKADPSKLVIRFSKEKPIDIVVLGPRGGETKIFKDNGTDFQKKFLNLTFVKGVLGKSFVEIQQESNQQIIKGKKELSDLVKKSPEKKGLIDALKDKISKKETEKKEKEREFYKTIQTSTASWYLCTLFVMSGCRMASSISVRNSVWASLALPPSPGMLLLTFTCAPKMQ